MLKRIELNNEREIGNWDSFIEGLDSATPFQHSSWIRLIRETYNYEPLLYVYVNRAQEIVGVFPFFLVKVPFAKPRIVSVPFSDYGGPLFTDPADEKRALLEILDQDPGKIYRIEIRSNVTPGLPFVCHAYYKRHRLDLTSGPEGLKKNIDKKTILYSIRKAERSCIEIREDKSIEGMREFARLNTLTRKKHGVPSQPISFFENLHREMVSKGYASVLLALYESKVVAGGLFLKFRDTVYYKYNASDPAFLSKITPNHLMTWVAIDKSCAEGYRFFDFGRTSPDNEGLMRYKKMWGAEPEDLPYYYYPQMSGTSASEQNSLSYRLFTNLWRRLPDGVSERIGSRIFRFFG